MGKTAVKKEEKKKVTSKNALELVKKKEPASAGKKATVARAILKADDEGHTWMTIKGVPSVDCSRPFQDPELINVTGASRPFFEKDFETSIEFQKTGKFKGEVKEPYIEYTETITKEFPLTEPEFKAMYLYINDKRQHSYTKNFNSTTFITHALSAAGKSAPISKTTEGVMDELVKESEKPLGPSKEEIAKYSGLIQGIPIEQQLIAQREARKQQQIDMYSAKLAELEPQYKRYVQRLGSTQREARRAGTKLKPNTFERLEELQAIMDNYEKIDNLLVNEKRPEVAEGYSKKLIQLKPVFEKAKSEFETLSTEVKEIEDENNSELQSGTIEEMKNTKGAFKEYQRYNGLLTEERGAITKSSHFFDPIKRGGKIQSTADFQRTQQILAQKKVEDEVNSIFAAYDENPSPATCQELLKYMVKYRDVNVTWFKAEKYLNRMMQNDHITVVQYSAFDTLFNHKGWNMATTGIQKFGNGTTRTNDFLSACGPAKCPSCPRTLDDIESLSSFLYTLKAAVGDDIYRTLVRDDELNDGFNFGGLICDYKGGGYFVEAQDVLAILDALKAEPLFKHSYDRLIALLQTQYDKCLNDKQNISTRKPASSQSALCKQMHSDHHIEMIISVAEKLGLPKKETKETSKV